MSEGVFDPTGDPEQPAELGHAPTQKPMAIHTADYVETGFLSVGPAPDGGVLIGGGDPPGPALMLTVDNMICLEKDGRPECQHFVQFLTEAAGVQKGFGEQPKQIRRYCTRLATATELMELGEVAVFACSARKPQDLVSIRLIKDFERRQREIAAEHEQTHSEKEM